METSRRSASRSPYSDAHGTTGYEVDQTQGENLPYDQSGYDDPAQGWQTQPDAQDAGAEAPPYEPLYEPVQEPVPIRRKPLLTESMDKVSSLGLPERVPAAPTAYIAANAPRQANTKRGPNVGRLFLLLLFLNALMLAAFGAWFYNHVVLDLESRLADLATPSGGTAPLPGESKAPAQDAAELSALEARLRTDLSDIQTQLQASQKRLEAAELLNKQQSQSLQEVNAYLTASAARQSSTSPSGTASSQAGAAPTVPVLTLPGSQAEMVVLKERNRLTSYADEAISTGARIPYEKLWEALDDPALSSVIHGARAEILRVQNFYLSGSRIDQYDIPVASYFPDSAALKDSQLKDDELIVLLSNARHPWQVRMKAANLLGLRRSKTAGDALVKAILEDQNLDVVKEATFSFEQMSGFRSRLFEPASVKAWWEQYNASATPPPAKP